MNAYGTSNYRSIRTRKKVCQSRHWETFRMVTLGYNSIQQPLTMLLHYAATWGGVFRVVLHLTRLCSVLQFNLLCHKTPSTGAKDVSLPPSSFVYHYYHTMLFIACFRPNDANMTNEYHFLFHRYSLRRVLAVFVGRHDWSCVVTFG